MRTPEHAQRTRPSLEDDGSGPVAVVTGGGSGIGRQVAIRLVADGVRVVVADRNGDGAEAVAGEIVASGGRAVPVRADVTSAEDTLAMVAAAEDAFGRLDILSCNAGVAGTPTPFTELTEDEFDRTFAVNVKGVWLSVTAAAPALRRAGGGSVVIVGSVMGERARPGFAAYASSKAAVNHLARTLALELAPDRIRVNALAPVATNTPMLARFLGSDDPEAARERFIAGIPLGRLAEPSDVAEATAFLASEAAAFITGVVLPVDGGRSV